MAPALAEAAVVFPLGGGRSACGEVKRLSRAGDGGDAVAASQIKAADTTHLGLVYLGLEFQRSFASNTLRGVSADASAVTAPLVAWVRDARRTIGVTTPHIHAPAFARPHRAGRHLGGAKAPAA